MVDKEAETGTAERLLEVFASAGLGAGIERLGYLMDYYRHNSVYDWRRYPLGVLLDNAAQSLEDPGGLRGGNGCDMMLDAAFWCLAAAELLREERASQRQSGWFRESPRWFIVGGK